MKPSAKWEKTLDERLPFFGHRNWIVVADAAYPAQSSQGIETIVSGVSQQVAVKTVLTRLRACKHIRPVIHVDRELALVDEKDAQGNRQLSQLAQRRVERTQRHHDPA